MRLFLCSVFDSKVGAYAAPFTVRSKGEAYRSFELACKDANMPFAKHPADYRLYVIGEFDDNDGKIVAVGPDPMVGADEIVFVDTDVGRQSKLEVVSKPLGWS